MVLVSILVVLQIGAVASPELKICHRMQAYESLFDGATFDYSEPGRATKFTLERMGGREAFLADGKTILSLDHGQIARYVTNNQNEVSTSIAYGSTIQGSVNAMRADLRTVLFWLGARAPGDKPMSEAFDVATEKKISEVAGILTASFTTNADHLKMRITWKSGEVIPRSVEIGSLVYSLKQGSNGTWLISVVPAVEGKVGSPLLVQQPTPIKQSPRVIEVHVGDRVYDEHYNIRYIEAVASAPSDTAVADAISRALAGTSKSVKGEQRKLLCGLDSLYYLSKLLNKPCDYDVLLNQLPEAKFRGATLEELRATAERNGLKLTGYEISWDELKRLGRPAILSWRPSHFVVYVPKSSAIINPPFSTESPNPEQASAFYTGRALVLEP